MTALGSFEYSLTFKNTVGKAKIVLFLSVYSSGFGGGGEKEERGRSEKHL